MINCYETHGKWRVFNGNAQVRRMNNLFNTYLFTDGYVHSIQTF